MFSTSDYKFPRRSCSAWRPCLIPVLDDLLPIYNTPKVGEHASMENMNVVGYGNEGDDGGGTMDDVEMDIDIVSTAFDPSLSENRKFPAVHDSRRLNIAWTRKERELAEMGDTVGDLSELRRRVSG
jgi:hypothetical protein